MNKWVGRCIGMLYLITTLVVGNLAIIGFNTQKVEASAASWDQWNQTDPEWSSKNLGGGGSVHDIGCYVTSEAIQIYRSKFNKIDGKDFNPGTYVDFLNSKGLVAGGAKAFNSASVATNGEFSRDNSMSWDTSSGQGQQGFEQKSDKEKLDIIGNIIQKGEYPIISMHSVVKDNVAQHWIAVNDVKDGKITIFDPATDGTEFPVPSGYGSEQYTVKSISGVVAYKSTKTPISNSLQKGSGAASAQCKEGDSSASSETSDVRKKMVELAEDRVKAKIPYSQSNVGWDTQMDCSFFVQEIYKRAANIDISRTTYTQSVKPEFEEVSAKDAKPGDLLFYGGKGSSCYHVAMYAGDGQLFEEPEPGKHAQKQAVYGKPWYARYKGLDDKKASSDSSSKNSSGEDKACKTATKTEDRKGTEEGLYGFDTLNMVPRKRANDNIGIRDGKKESQQVTSIAFLEAGNSIVHLVSRFAYAALAMFVAWSGLGITMLYALGNDVGFGEGKGRKSVDSTNLHKANMGQRVDFWYKKIWGTPLVIAPETKRIMWSTLFTGLILFGCVAGGIFQSIIVTVGNAISFLLIK